MAHLAFVDADLAAAQSAAHYFAQRGHHITLIASGSEAIDRVRRERPDAIVLCVEIPQVSGYTLCNKLKRDPELGRIPLLLVSAQASPETFEEHKRLRTRADAYAHKPYKVAELRALLAGLVPEVGAQTNAAEPAPGAPVEEVSAAAGQPERPMAFGQPAVPPRKVDVNAVRLGEDPSVRDISAAPFLPGSEPAAEPAPPPSAAAEPSGGRTTRARRTTAPASLAEPALLSTHAELLLERAVDLGASTQLYKQADLVGRALSDLAEAPPAAEGSSSEAAAGPAAAGATAKPRRSRKPRRSTASRETVELPAPAEADALALQVAQLREERDHWRRQAEAAKPSAEAVPQAMGPAAEHADALRAQLVALEQRVLALSSQLTQLTEQKAAAEHAALRLRHGLLELLEAPPAS